MGINRLFRIAAVPLRGHLGRVSVIAAFGLAKVLLAGTNVYGGDSIAWAHSFGAGEGQGPSAGLTQADNGNFYGTAPSATSKSGSFFQVTPNGTFTVLYTFNADRTDGGASGSALLQGVNAPDGKRVFYGTCIGGGAFTTGSVFRIATDGTRAGTTSSVIHSFGPVFPDDGAFPIGGLADGGDDGSGNRILYGTTQAGGASYNKGILFKLTTNGTLAGTTFVILHRFGQLDDNFNYDGAYPYVTLVKGSDGNFYGTTSDDGTSGYGTLFEFLPTGGGFHTLYALTQLNGGGSGPSGLVEGSPGVFYGTANAGGAHFEGSVFQFTLNGSFGGSYARIYSFSAVDQTGFNSDGANPLGGLSRDSDGNFYGTTTYGGAHGRGSVFTITPGGMLTPLYVFSAVDANHVNADGADPQGGVVRDATGHLYGTTQQGGLSALGTVFGLNPGALPAITAFSATGPVKAGAAMHFSATTAAGVNVHVQFSTTPDDGNSWHPLLDGGAMTEQPVNSGSYVLDSTAYPAGMGFYFRAVGSRPGFVDSVSPAPYPGPFDNLHPPVGLYATTFTVNESSLPSGNVADTALRFVAKQGGRPAGLSVRVQVSTSPGVPDSWTYLPDNNHGQMGYDGNLGQFVLNSTSYPVQNGTYFRAICTATGIVPDSFSNVVGGFDLASSVAHVTPPAMFFTGNGNIADLYFRAAFPVAPSGVAVRIQASTTPGDESSWNDLANGNAGHMTQSIDPKQFLLLVNQYPAANGIYFRSVSSSASSISGLSLPCGPFDLVSDTPPIVTIAPPTGLNGDGHGHTPEDPIVYPVGALHFTAHAVTQRAMQQFKLQCDGRAFSVSTTSTVPADPTSPIDDLSPTVGDHVIDAVAIDDLGARGRAGTDLLYVRVIPDVGVAKGTNRTAPALLSGKVFTVVNSGGFWHDPATWQDSQGNFGVPGLNDLAIVGASTVIFSDPGFDGFEVKSVSISGGHLIGPSILTVHGTITISGGSFDNDLNLIIATGAVCELTNPDNFTFGDGSNGTGALNNVGTINVHGSGGLLGVADFRNRGVLNWNVPLAIPPNAAVDPAAATRQLQTNSFSNSGTIAGTASALISQDGSSLISQDGSNVVSNDGGTIVAQGGGNIVAQGGGNIVAQGGGNIVAQGGGNLVNTNGSNRPAGSGGQAAATPSGFTQTAGETNLTAVSISGSVTLNGGVLTGSGIIDGGLTNNSGYIAPGHSAGRIAVTGNFTQGADGILIVENGGFYPNQFDQLQVGGTATLGGKLDVKTINGYMPLTADTFSPLGYSSATGSFASVSSNAQVTVNATGLIMSVDPTAPPPASGQALNISTRMEVLSDDNVLICGFIVSGPSGSTKKVLIRGIGPSLAQLGILGTLSDPFLELHKPDGSVVANDNWADAPNVGEIPAGFQPTDSHESIVIATLAPGSYTAIVKGAQGQTGVGLAEVYDLDSPSSAKLTNVSTRGFIDTGDNVMIGGFIVGGGEPAAILVRAIGPSLVAFGVQGALGDPVLELHDANGSSFNNDDWRESQESEIIATTIPPSNDREPAILATLVPGSYTAIVRGKNDTTGIGLVEAYNLQ